MAYMSQEKKKEIAAELKKVVPKGWKYRLGVRHHSTLVMVIRSAPVDLVDEHNRAVYINNPGYEPDEHGVVGRGRLAKDNFSINTYVPPQMVESNEVFKKILKTLNTGNYDNSDIQSDYFDYGFFVDLKVGAWDKPFMVK